MKVSLNPVPHGVPGQINVCVLDKESEITGFGKHNRLLVFGSLNEPVVTVREDIKGLPLSTEVDRKKVLCGWQRLHPRGKTLVLVSSVEYQSGLGQAIEHTYSY